MCTVPVLASAQAHAPKRWLYAYDLWLRGKQTNQGVEKSLKKKKNTGQNNI